MLLLSLVLKKKLQNIKSDFLILVLFRRVILKIISIIKPSKRKYET